MVRKFFVHLVDVGTKVKTSVEVGGYQRANQIVNEFLKKGAFTASIEIIFYEENKDAQ